MSSPYATLFVLPAVLLLAAVVQLLMPRFTRPDLWFSVTVDPGFRDTDEGRRILRIYRLTVLLHLLGSSVPEILGAIQQRMPLFLAGVAWQLIGFTLAFLSARRRTLPHAVVPATAREAALEPHPKTLPGGSLLQAGPFILLAGIALWLRTQWERIPERFPVHWGMGGQPDRWASRTPVGVFGPLVAGALMCLAFLLLSYVLQTRSRRIHATGRPGQAENRFRRVTEGILLGAEYFMALTFSIPPLLSFVQDPALPGAIIVSGSLLFGAATFFFFVRVGQGGSRQAPAPATPPAGDRTADAFWKLGLFYVNRSDPALFVEKRFGFGYTLNFGNPWSWVTLLLLLGAPLALSSALGLAGRH